jgi:hypothetical protein
VATNEKQNKMPGIIPAKNNLPIDVSVMRPYTIRATLGGIMEPNDPTVATVPVEILLSYPCLSISGIENVAKVAAVAADDPHMVLKIAAAIIVVRSSPHGI